jgi:hypothetical protein
MLVLVWSFKHNYYNYLVSLFVASYMFRPLTWPSSGYLMGCYFRYYIVMGYFVATTLDNTILSTPHIHYYTLLLQTLNYMQHWKLLSSILATVSKLDHLPSVSSSGWLNRAYLGWEARIVRSTTHTIHFHCLAMNSLRPELTRDCPDSVQRCSKILKFSTIFRSPAVCCLVGC